MPAPEHITIRVLLFAGLKQKIGRDFIMVSLPASPTVDTLVAAIARDFPVLEGLLATCRVAVDREFVSSSKEITRDSEIALIPPVSGGIGSTPENDRYRLSFTELESSEVLRSVTGPGSGGVVTFVGNVRDTNRGREVLYLEYEAYEPMALHVLRSIGAELEREHPGSKLSIHHRLGRLGVGETAVVIAASAPHREEAFAACRAAIERLKQDAPIWKREVWSDGSEWIGRGP